MISSTCLNLTLESSPHCVAITFISKVRSSWSWAAIGALDELVHKVMASHQHVGVGPLQLCGRGVDGTGAASQLHKLRESLSHGLAVLEVDAVAGRSLAGNGAGWELTPAVTG